MPAPKKELWHFDGRRTEPEYGMYFIPAGKLWHLTANQEYFNYQLEEWRRGPLLLTIRQETFLKVRDVAPSRRVEVKKPLNNGKHALARDVCVKIPPDKIQQMVGCRIHLGWAYVGANWLLVKVEGDVLYLETPKTKKKMLGRLEDAYYTHGHAEAQIRRAR